MTSSTGCNGLTCSGRPPRATMPSRMAARSTTQGTPVKSCSSTRAGMNDSSRWPGWRTSQVASARMSSAFTKLLSSRRSRFSSRMRSENGSRPTAGNPAASSAGRLKKSTASPLTVSDWRVLKVLSDMDTRGELTANDQSDRHRRGNRGPGLPQRQAAPANGQADVGSERDPAQPPRLSVAHPIF